MLGLQQINSIYDNKVQTCFRAQSGRTSCLGSFAAEGGFISSLSLSVSLSASAHFIAASPRTEQLLVCVEPQGPAVHAIFLSHFPLFCQRTQSR